MIKNHDHEYYIFKGLSFTGILGFMELKIFFSDSVIVFSHDFLDVFESITGNL